MLSLSVIRGVARSTGKWQIDGFHSKFGGQGRLKRQVGQKEGRRWRSGGVESEGGEDRREGDGYGRRCGKIRPADTRAGDMEQREIEEQRAEDGGKDGGTSCYEART